MKAHDKRRKLSADAPWSGSRNVPTHFTTLMMGVGLLAMLLGSITYPVLIIVGIAVFVLGLVIAFVSAMVEGVRGK
jgi:hypothetical protein